MWPETHRCVCKGGGGRAGEGLRKLCDEVAALLVFDEVQCGLGCTGVCWGWWRCRGRCGKVWAAGTQDATGGPRLYWTTDVDAGQAWEMEGQGLH